MFEFSEEVVKGRKKSLVALIRDASRVTDVQRQLWSAVCNVATGAPMTDALRVKSIVAMIALAEDGARHELWEHVNYLVHSATNNGKRIPLEQFVAWYTLLSEKGQHRSVQQGLQLLINREMRPDARTVFTWAKNAMGDYRDFKPAAMLLVNGKCTHWKVLRTRTLCDWVVRSTAYYDGDHGAVRLFALLCIRMRRLQESYASYQDAIETLAYALHHVHRDHSIFKVLMDGMVVRVPPRALPLVLASLRKRLAGEEQVMRDCLTVIEQVETGSRTS